MSQIQISISGDKLRITAGSHPYIEKINGLRMSSGLMQKLYQNMWMSLSPAKVQLND